VFLQSPQIGFQQPKNPLGIPCARARTTQTDYETLLALHHASRFGDVLLNTAKVIFEAIEMKPGERPPASPPNDGRVL
jgi:hypothetical protein